MESSAPWDFVGPSLGLILDRIHVGAVLLDESGRIAFANSRARDLLQSGTPVLETDGRLAVWPPQKKHFDRLLWSAMEGRRDAHPLTLGAYDEEHRMIMVIEPLHAEPLTRSRWTIAWIVDSDGAEPNCEWLAALHQLTPAEKNVTLNLARGLSTVEVARKLSISVATLRTHLRRIFGKTGCQNQAALVRLAHLLPISPIAVHHVQPTAAVA